MENIEVKMLNWKINWKDASGRNEKKNMSQIERDNRRKRKLQILAIVLFILIVLVVMI